MIDTLRKQIQERLDLLLVETEKLRKALSALDQRGGQASAHKAPSRPRTGRARTTSRSTSRTTRRTPPGTTKARVLKALSDGKAMTAGEVAAATGLGRATVSTTLSKLAKSGEVRKAKRGYARRTTAS